MRRPSDAYDPVLEFKPPAGAAGSRDAVAALLAERLGEHGYRVMAIDDRLDDEISWVELANIPPFVAKIGVMEHPARADRLLALIYPPLPYVRIWLRRVSTVPLVTALGEATTSVLESGGATDVRWLGEHEAHAL